MAVWGPPAPRGPQNRGFGVGRQRPPVPTDMQCPLDRRASLGKAKPPELGKDPTVEFPQTSQVEEGRKVILW